MQRQGQNYEEQSVRIERIMKPRASLSENLLFLGPVPYVDRVTIVSRVPPRYLCDLLISQYFRSLEPAIRKYIS
jgi:hypothetical protein